MVVCYLCKSSKEDDVQYGELLKKGNMAVHTFCLYLSSNLTQNGNDDEGFLGFLEADIREEAKRVSYLHCIYCRKPFANVGCCKSKCRSTFHFICGLENSAENQFCGSFKSFCKRHTHNPVHSRLSANAVCVICYDNLLSAGQRFNRVTMIQAPCCRNGWFHKLCLQRFAKTAGYFFKCPLCNDTQVFREQLPARGIFIPNQDAAWELEPNAFAELLERPSECAATECQCEEGRTHSSDSNRFIFCSTCGSTAMHSRCMPKRVRRFHCADCTVALEQDSGRESLNLHASNNENDEEIDVCNVDDKEDLEIVQGILRSNEPQNRKDNEKRTQNSCSSDDEEIKLLHTRRARLFSSDSNSREKKSEENQRPSSRNQSSLSDDEVPLVSFIQRRKRKLPARRVIRDSTSSQEDSITSTSGGLRTMQSEEVTIREELSPKQCSSRGEIEKIHKSQEAVDMEEKWNTTVEESSEDEVHSSRVQRCHNSISSGEVAVHKTDAKLIEQLKSDDDVIPKIQCKLHSKTDQTSDNITKHNNKRNQSSLSDDDVSLVSFIQRRKRKLPARRVIRDSTSSGEDSINSTSSELRTMQNEEVTIRQELSPKQCSSRGKIEKIHKSQQAVNMEEKWNTDVEECSEGAVHSARVQRNHNSIYSGEVAVHKTDAKLIEQLKSDDNVIPKIQCKLHSKPDQISDNITKHNKKIVEISTIDGGSNDDVCKTLAKSTNAQTNKATERDSAVAELYSSEESDDDPVENFSKMLEKQNNMSCIAQRTRTKSIYAENPHEYYKQLSSYSSADPVKSSQFQESLSEEKKKENLDISCIARRTRRKSMYNAGNKMIQAKESKSLSRNQARNPIRTRDRRKTVCSETPVEKNKQHKRHQDARQTKIISCEDSRDPTPNHSPVFQTSAIYEIHCDTIEDIGAHNNVLEISCIANRTRKRKSIKMQNITDDDGLTLSSCSSASSYKTALTDFGSNYAWPRRQRILSISSEDTENAYKDASRPLNNDKNSKQKYDMTVQKTKLHLTNSSSYHPNNIHHPHINNCRRVF